jgi:hypothetical protein
MQLTMNSCVRMRWIIKLVTSYTVLMALMLWLDWVT